MLFRTWSLVLVLTLKRTYGLMKADRNEQGQFLEELVNCTLEISTKQKLDVEISLFQIIHLNSVIVL